MEEQYLAEGVNSPSMNLLASYPPKLLLDRRLEHPFWAL